MLAPPHDHQHVACFNTTGAIQAHAFASQWVSEYTRYNIRELDVLYLPSTGDYVLVHELHPAICLLQHNADLLGADIKDYPRVDAYWIPVDTDTFERCCTTILETLPAIPRLKFFHQYKLHSHSHKGSPRSCAVM